MTTICDKAFCIKACTMEDGRIIAVKIIPESIAICPVFNVEFDGETFFETRELAIESLVKKMNDLTSKTNEEEEENE